MSSADSDDGFGRNMEWPPKRSFQPKVARRYRLLHDLYEEDQIFLEKVWKDVWDHNLSMPFRQPVDVSQPNVDTTSYLQIIYDPMDLESIRLRLKNRYYETAEDCIKDFNTIFSNCYVYNTIKKQHWEIRDMAISLRRFFQEKIRAMPNREDDEVVLSFKSPNMEKKKIFWTVKLEDVPEDEMRMILPLLSHEDLKNLKLCSKKCALMVTQFDSRMNQWHFKMHYYDDKDDIPVIEIFEYLSLAKEQEYFRYIDVTLDINSDVGITLDEISENILEVCKDNLVKLSCGIKHYDNDDGKGCTDEDFNDEDFVDKLRVTKLQELNIYGCPCRILNNKNITETVRSITIRWPQYVKETKCSFPNLHYLSLNHGFAGNLSKLLCSQLSTLIVISSRDYDFEKVPMMPHLKKLVVDASSVKLLKKCSDKVEDLTFTSLGTLGKKNLVVPNDLICPKLKQLVFGLNIPPNWKFIMNQTSTLEKLVVPGMSNSWEPCPVFNRINDYDLDKLKTIIRDSPCLHTLVLPSNLKNKIRDETGKVKIFFNIQDAAKFLSLNTRFLFQSQLDRYLPLQ